jgi:hypothetical protein
MHHRRWALCSGTDVQGNNSQQVSTGITEMKDGLNRTLKMEGANISSRGEMWCEGEIFGYGLTAVFSSNNVVNFVAVN